MKHAGMRTDRPRPDWRTYQRRLNRGNVRRRRLAGLLRIGGFVCLIGLCLWWMQNGILDSAVLLPEEDDAEDFAEVVTIAPPPASDPHGEDDADASPKARPIARVIREQDLLGEPSEPLIKTLAGTPKLINPREPRVTVRTNHRRLIIETSLDHDLQNFLLDRIDQNTTRYAGMVVMDPLDGRILAMASHDRSNPNNNLCIDSIFPAASIFKIVTAAAAVDACGMGAETPLAFTGGKHTLYKSQIKKSSRRRSHTMSLKDSFAQSVNPVFGKIGAHYLGRDLLETYADAFGFNRKLPFDLPVAPSPFDLSDDPYHLAELASGFNRKTRISPLHGALIAAEAAYGNAGPKQPSLVERVVDDTGAVLYERQPRDLKPILSDKAVRQMRDMMAETIDSGTCRKYFRGYRKDTVLSRLVMGGKTGSINSRRHEGRRYDWFVGFAESKDLSTQIVLSIVICHEKYIGTQSREFARMVIGEYFKNQFLTRESGERMKKKDPGTAM